MSLKHHVKSALFGIGFAGICSMGAGLVGIGFGALTGASAVALCMPLVIGGACLWGAGVLVGHAMGPEPDDPKPLKQLTSLAAAAITGYCILANYAPTKNSMPYRNQIFGTAPTGLRGSFNHAVREVNKHIIWPDMGAKPAHQRPPEP